MGDFQRLVNNVRMDKESFSLLAKKMEPLVNKYTYLLYRDEKEDMKEELTIALWEAVKNITEVQNDGQVINYFSMAVRNRFFELYRRSRKYHDNEVVDKDDSVLLNTSYREKRFDEIMIKEDIILFLNKFSGQKRKIYYSMLIGLKTDREIADRFCISRQYINRMRRKMRGEIANYFVP